MRDKLFKKLAGWHANHPGRMLIFVLVLTLIFTLCASQLTVTMRWSDLLPTNDKRTLEYNRIVDEFVSATSIIVVVQGEESAIKSFADDLAPRLKQATLESDTGSVSLIQRVDFKAETAFLKENGLMLIKADDLKNMQDMYTDANLTGLITNINNAMEKEYVGREESISSRQKEDNATYFLGGIEAVKDLLQKTAGGEPVSDSEMQAAVDELLFGEPYFLSYDRQALILNAIPNFTIMDMHLVIEGTAVIQELLDDLVKKYPGVSAGMTGFIPIAHDEMVYSEQSLGTTSLIAVIAILILLIVSFRMWIAPLFAMGNLLIGILWAIGVVAVTVGQLNIMTQMMAVILLGLGIDFAIHLVSGFTEYRANGLSISKALEETFLKVGKGVFTGGLTTACAFYAMAISQSRGMREMGLTTGSGLLAVLLATFLILPIFLVYRERNREKKAAKTNTAIPVRDLSFAFLGNTGAWLAKHYKITLIAALILTGLMLWSASTITFDSNYMNIEPEGITSVVLQDTILHKFDLSTDYAMVLTDNPAASREKAKAYRDLNTVAMVEDISSYLPSEREQNQRAPYLDSIRKKLKGSRIRNGFTKKDLETLKTEVDRLRMNIIEMQDMAYLGGQDKVEKRSQDLVGDPESENPKDAMQDLLETLETSNTDSFARLQRMLAPYFRNTVLRMSNTNQIVLDDLPETVLDRYSNKDRTQYLVTVYPAGSVWQDADFLKRFVFDVEGVSDRATGMPPVFYALIDIIGKDGRLAMMLTLLVVFVLLWIDFGKAQYALMAMIPLTAGLVWMVGLMKLTGQQFTAMNVMGLPMILGIGIDDGVHVVHRWLAEGKGRISTVFASTGKAILLTSLTTMLGFGSLVFSIWRGFGHLGAALFVGVAACFLTTILFLAGVIGWVERK